jgi:glycosyltransferase involved in cell wall biosynthesis
VQRLVYLGRLIRAKGIFEAIEAIEALRTEEQFRDIELRIAGSGPAREEIERYIGDHGLGNSVKLVGSVFGNEKMEFLREADVFVFPSYHKEGLPYTILESLAAGTPVITSRVAGIPDIVVDGVHGILVNTKDPGDIVRAIRQLGQSQDALRIMSTTCVEWASQKFGLEHLATQFDELYEKVVLGEVQVSQP